MKIKAVLSGLLVILFLAFSFDADAQRRNKYQKQRRNKSKSISNYKGGSIGGRFRPYEFVTFNVNALNYFGDLAPVNKAASTDVSFTRPGFGGHYGYKFNPRMAFRVGFNYGRIKGDDFTSDPNDEESKPRYTRNLSFRNDIKEISGGFEIYLLPNWGGPNMRPDLNLYLFVGGAVFHHEPKGLVPEMDYTTGGTEPAPHAGEWVKLRPLGTEGQFILDDIVEDLGGTVDFDVKTYSPFQLSVPVALGARFRLPAGFDAGIEFGYRFLFTDYIDDVSGYYVSHNYFDDDLARIMADRSAEPTAYWAGLDRVGVNVASQTFSDGVTYQSASDVGGGLVQWESGQFAIRGNPRDKDMIFITTLKLTYILGQTRSSAKFR